MSFQNEIIGDIQFPQGINYPLRAQPGSFKGIRPPESV